MQSKDYPILRNCPFCGGKAESFKSDFAKYGEDGKKFKRKRLVACPECRIGIENMDVIRLEKGKTIIEIDGYTKCIEAWDRRVDNG